MEVQQWLYCLQLYLLKKTSQDIEESDSHSETKELEQQPEKRDQNKIEEQTKTEEQTKIGVNNVQKLRL